MSDTNGEDSVYLLGYEREVLWARLVVEFVDINNEHLSLVFVADEVVVAVVESLQILYWYFLLASPSSLLYVLHEVWHGRPEINHEVGQLHLLHHNLVELHISLEVAVGHVALRVVVGCKHEHSLMESAVLNHHVA